MLSGFCGRIETRCRVKPTRRESRKYQMLRFHSNPAARLVRASVALAALSAGLFSPSLCAQSGFAQSGSVQSNGSGDLGWKRVGGTTINRGLAGPSTGPVRNLWYNDKGSGLVVQTASGRVLETSDFQHWRLNAGTSQVAPLSEISQSPSIPEPGARVQAVSNRLYATGAENIYASDDGGRTWLNLTGFNGRSIIGEGFTALGVSPNDPKDVSAANAQGVWRSLDGGLSWHSLNEDLPNLPVRRLSGRRSLVMADDSQVVLEGGKWKPAASAVADPETELMTRASRPGLRISTATQASGIAYSGSADGRLYTSRDGGGTWTEAPQSVGAPVSRIWVDAGRPQTALAIAGSRIFRTVNAGLFWDDVTGALPQTRIHALAADRSASVIYAATDRGVLTASLSLDEAGPAATAWRSINRNLPAAAAWDLRLNPDNTLTVALDGYGVFETQAPHRSRAVRLVNAADMSDRAAAPGSLLTVLNAGVIQARANLLAYPVIATSELSSQLQVPFEAAAGSYQIALNGADGGWTLPVNVKDASPAIFVDSEGAPLLVDSTSGLVMDTNVAVRAGASVSLLAAGLGRVAPEWPAGIPAPFDAPPAVVGAVTAWLDGIPVEVSRATLAPGYVGYYSVELKLPRIVNRGAADLRLVMNGQESNHVRLYIEP